MPYMTNHKKRILDFLIDHKDRHYTIDEIVRALSVGEKKPGKSTVYRLVGKLCEEGKLSRLRDGERGCFVYAYAEDTRGCDGQHFHLKCLGCGRLFHLECRHSEALCEHIAETHHFRVDSGRTLLFGECENCRRAADKL